ncbi:MAG: hypothetical protein V1897_13460 [Pseudomonadota bacterium]
MESNLSGNNIHGLPEEIVCGVAVRAINNNRILVTPKRITKYSITGKPEESFTGWLSDNDDTEHEISELIKMTGDYLSRAQRGETALNGKDDPVRRGIIKILEERGVPHICEPGTWMETRFGSKQPTRH